MDKYLFKGESVRTGKWVYGFYFKMSYNGSYKACIGTEPISANDYGEIYEETYEEVYEDTVALCES